MDSYFYQSTDRSHSPIHILMAEAAMQAADLLKKWCNSSYSGHPAIFLHSAIHTLTHCWNGQREQFGVQCLVQGYYDVQLGVPEIGRLTFPLVNDPKSLFWLIISRCGPGGTFCSGGYPRSNLFLCVCLWRVCQYSSTKTTVQDAAQTGIKMQGE